MKVNRERIAEHFTTLCEIESPSRKEKKVSEYLQKQFQQLGADKISIDQSASKTGSETGNLFITLNGNNKWDTSLFFCCHMDTVEPANGVRVIRNGDVFRSKGDTILGADDKSGIASLIELITLLNENSITHCPIEMVFTTCEEIGLLGAKSLDRSMILSKYGYALDSTMNGKVVTGAPAANRININITGKAAHSGSSPESGINALSIAADAITRIKLGRIDEISTANFGLIQGGTASNIVPEQVSIVGEVRSHSPEMLAKYTQNIQIIFKKVVENWPDCENGSSHRPTLDIEIEEDFPVMSLDKEEEVLSRITDAAALLKKEIDFDIAGGGSDANIFCGYGLPTAILPTGMDKVHTTEEQIDLKDMESLTELLVALVTEK